MKTFFYKNILKNHYYFWETILENDFEQTFYLQLSCHDYLKNELYVLTLTNDNVKTILTCFRYFTISSLSLNDGLKFWLKYCANLDNLKEVYENLGLIHENAKQVKEIFGIESNHFEMVELFYFYYPLITVYKSLSVLLDNVNKL